MSDEKKIINIEVRGKIAKLVNPDDFLVCGNNDYEVHFDFDNDWDVHQAKTALFVFGDKTIPEPFSGNICKGVAIKKATKCYIGAFTGDIITTTKAEVRCIPSISDIAKTPETPDEDVYNKLIQLINQLAGGSGIIVVNSLPTSQINRNAFYLFEGTIYWYDGKWNKVVDKEHLDIALAYKQDNLAFDGDYDKQTNKVATESTVKREETRASQAEQTLDLRIDDVESIAKGANQSVSYETYEKMLEKVNSLPQNAFNIGQNIYIGTLEVPDLWVSDISTVSEPFVDYIDEKAFADYVAEYKRVKVGYFVLSALETHKVDLTDYAKKKNVDIANENAQLAVDNSTQALAYAYDSNVRSIETSADLKTHKQEFREQVDNFNEVHAEFEARFASHIEDYNAKVAEIGETISEETSRATQKEDELATSISYERARAEGKEQELRADLEITDAIAKGANVALSFADYATAIDVFNKLDENAYRVGQNIMIVTLNVPDLWVSKKHSDKLNYDFEAEGGEDTVLMLLESNGYIRVGHYELSPLETQKVEIDLTSYVKNTDIASFGKLGLMRVKGAHGMSITEDGYVYPGRVNRPVIDARTNYRWLDCGVVDDIVASAIKNCKNYTTDTLTLTDTEKSSAAKWLGMIKPVTYNINCSGEYASMQGDYKAYHISDDMYFAEQLIGAKVNYLFAPNTLTYEITSSMITGDANGITISVDGGYIFIVYNTDYAPSQVTSPFPKTGMYFSSDSYGDYFILSLELNNVYNLDKYEKYYAPDYNNNVPNSTNYIGNRPCYMGDDVVTFTPEKQTNNATKVGVEGERVAIGLVTNDIISLDDLRRYKVKAASFTSNDSNKQYTTIPLEETSVRVFDGGYVLSFGVSSDSPNAYILGCTDVSKFNSNVGARITSTGTYISKASVNYGGTYHFLACESLEKTSVKKLDNVYLDLENSYLIRDILARLDALES